MWKFWTRVRCTVTHFYWWQLHFRISSNFINWKNRQISTFQKRKTPSYDRVSCTSSSKTLTFIWCLNEIWRLAAAQPCTKYFVNCIKRQLESVKIMPLGKVFNFSDSWGRELSTSPSAASLFHTPRRKSNFFSRDLSAQNSNSPSLPLSPTPGYSKNQLADELIYGDSHKSKQIRAPAKRLFVFSLSQQIFYFPWRASPTGNNLSTQRILRRDFCSH